MASELAEWLAWLARRPSLREAYEAGKDKAKNGANTTNCHFRLFCDKEHTAAWERGVRDGEEEAT